VGGTSTNENGLALDSSTARRFGGDPLRCRSGPASLCELCRQTARLFRSDPQTGWRNATNLQTTLINAAGEEWSIRTDENGQRLIPQDPGARRRILILGDSLSFGEGIDIKDRFDVRMLSFCQPRAS
jgi:hypothetical protein